MKRALEHNIELTDDSLARLNEGVRLASEKNLDDTLILVGQAAFVVSVKNKYRHHCGEQRRNERKCIYQYKWSCDRMAGPFERLFHTPDRLKGMVTVLKEKKLNE